MRKQYTAQLEQLHTELIQMGALCEEAINNAAQALLTGQAVERERAIALELEIDDKERDVETLCLKLLLQQQPVAGDLRRIAAAQKMSGDLERIGDQAADIAEISAFLADNPLKNMVAIADMAKAASHMVTESLDSFVQNDLAKALAVIDYDDVVDDLFAKVRRELIALIGKDGAKNGEICLDLLMVAKYFERIGDHAENIAEWVVYAMTGKRTASADR